jgi:hypothetical protein
MVIRNTIKRMHNSKGAETRETLLGFLAGYKAGVFSTPTKS